MMKTIMELISYEIFNTNVFILYDTSILSLFLKNRKCVFMFTATYSNKNFKIIDLLIR